MVLERMLVVQPANSQPSSAVTVRIPVRIVNEREDCSYEPTTGFGPATKTSQAKWRSQATGRPHITGE